MRNYSVYNTLLGSYTKSEKTLDKAESTFQKMRDLGFLLKPSPYNSMISLYGQLKKQDMVEKLQRELKETNVKEMEKSKTALVDEKGKKPDKDRPIAVKLVFVPIEEANDLWNEYKNEGKVKDSKYPSAIRSLLKLKNVQEAEKLYGEWYPNGPKLDMSIPELLISPFRTEGNESKVEELVKSIRKKRIVKQLKMLVNVVIPRPNPNQDPTHGVGKVFLEYANVNGASKARTEMHGRKFGGNQVFVVYYPESRYAHGDYTG
ncbi:unnamed protein product [Arabis nemorensis]|uniref:RRM domain-containing protein n=1 Tax=Arabis nemorensis TaxID=586526 RepID=A0A565AXU7_9BRAS|nr:unnamed protein product [Arabis nemorensis]